MLVVRAATSNQHTACLSEPVSALSGDPDDSGNPPGTWLVDVKLRDPNRALEWLMRSSFQLKAGGATDR